MGRRFIPNCRRASSRTSTRFSSRSRPSSDRGVITVGGYDFPARIPAGTSNTEHRTSNIQTAAPLSVGRSAFDVEISMFEVWPAMSPESDGCLVALAVFKTVVGSLHGSRYVRFVPSPPFDLRFTIYDLRFEEPTRAAASAGPCVYRKSQFVNPEEGR